MLNGIVAAALFDFPEMLRVVPWNVFLFRVMVVAVGATPIFTLTDPEADLLLPAVTVKPE